MTLSVGKCQIHLVDVGQGTPTLFLHGNPDSSEVWSGIIPGLSGQLRCIAPDLPGFGRSTAPADFDCSLEGMAAFVDQLVKTLGISEPLNLVVHDVGGPYGLAWAVRHPEKLKSVVIMNTVFSSDFRWHLFGRLWRTPLVGELVQALTNRQGFVRELQRASRKLTKAQMNRTYDLITPGMKRMVLRWYRAMDTKHFAGWEGPLRQLLAAKPSLVLWADHDPYIDNRFADSFGAATVEHFPESGHWLPAEEPVAVTERLQRFFGALPA